MQICREPVFVQAGKGSVDGYDTHTGRDRHVEGCIVPAVVIKACFRPLESRIKGAAADGLVDKISGVEIQGADHMVHVAMAGNHDHLSFRCHLFDLFEYFESVHAGHFKVGEYDAGVMFPNQLKAGFTIFSGQHRIAVGIQKQTEHGQGGGFIVNDQNRFRGIHRNGHSLKGRLDNKDVSFLPDGIMIPETRTFATISLQGERQPVEDNRYVLARSVGQQSGNFFQLLVHALQASQPSLDASAFLKNPAIALGTETGLGRIYELANVFLKEIITRVPVRIVMDGLDRLYGDAERLTLIDRIIGNLSPTSCLVLVSRETPPLKLEQLRIHQELVVLNNDELAFTTDEIFRFYSDLYDLRLAPPQMARIREITDGWAGGLVLVWEALSHLPEAQRIDFIDHKLPVAMHGDRLAYFQPVGDVETILNSMVR